MYSDTINDAVTMQGGAQGALLAGRYRVVKQLGQGGMGSVWLAEDRQLDNKLFAVKMLPSILVSNKRAYRQLKDEAIVAMKLVHPNIVQIRAFEENNGNPFLVMDYVEGQTLDDCLDDWENLSEGEVVSLLRPIAAALDYAHDHGVVHRDIKPSNIMVRKDGVPFIMDFGIAREIQETMTRVTGKLSSGTLLYMSPEQLNGDKPTPAQDIYSFAAMVYECMKGEPPFVRGAIEDQIRNKTPEPLGGMHGVASVMAGLSKSPEERPKTCVAVLEGNVFAKRCRGAEGAAFRQGRRVSEEKQRNAARAKEPASRPSSQSHGGGVVIAIIVIFAALAGGGYFAWAKHDAMVKARKAEAARIAAKQRAKEEAAGSAMDNAGAAKRRAEEASSSKYATKSFGDAVKLFESANEKFAGRQFDEARTTFAVAAERFENCIVEAKAERKRQEAAARKAAEEARMEAERKAATEIRIEAKIQQGMLERISDANGFKANKDSLMDTFNRAEAFYDEKAKRWADAAALYTNYVERSKPLISLDGERQRAVAKKGEVQVAFKKAEEVGAKTHARDIWNTAVKTWKAADAELGRMEFAAAAKTFATALREFDACADEARNNMRIADEKRAEEQRKEQIRIAEWNRISAMAAERKRIADERKANEEKLAKLSRDRTEQDRKKMQNESGERNGSSWSGALKGMATGAAAAMSGIRWR